ncbi:MAG: VOC family protein [Caldilineaceae bacterium]|nr:VOC family protein [Caldilineaceae bacterium]MBP8109742.1 VOC family protein [Caldilineaceae bacterium]MBP8121400.1 VOC family protein [Caldilineaceae bacterium]MBP9072702.1 VOC family protein [Caldilineaceae bacterium]
MSTVSQPPRPTPDYTLPAQMRLGAVQVRVANLARSVDFYTNTLGLAPLEDTPDPPGQAVLTANQVDPLLVLTELPAPRPKPGRATGLYHFAILFAKRADLGRALTRLLQTRYPLQGASDHLVSEALYLADPDGNGIELYWDRPRTVWPRLGEQIRMDSLPLDLDDLIADGRRAEAWTSVPASTVMGHVHLHVAHIAAAERFYRQVLGLDLMLRFGGSAIFLAAGGYHHHLGANVWAGVGAPPTPADAPGLDHWTLLLPGPADLAEFTAHLAASHIAFEEVEGGVFVTDPAGNRVAVRVG